MASFAGLRLGSRGSPLRAFSLHPFPCSSKPALFCCRRQLGQAPHSVLFTAARVSSPLSSSSSSSAFFASSSIFPAVVSEELELAEDDTATSPSSPKARSVARKFPLLSPKEKKDLRAYAHSLGKKIVSQQAEPVSLDVNSGAYWQSLLLEATNWKYVGYLGHGDSSMYAMKVARDGHTLDNDIKFLKELAGIDGIPQIFQEFDGDSLRLVLEPVGEPLKRKNLRRHYPAVIELSKLVDTFESAHRKNIVNKDIRIENIMIAKSLKDGQLRLFLLDWGFAATVGVADNFVGSLITASNSVLRQRISDCGTVCLYIPLPMILFLLSGVFSCSISGMLPYPYLIIRRAQNISWIVGKQP